MDSTKSSLATGVIVALVVGALLGGVIGRSTAMSKQDTTKKSVDKNSGMMMAGDSAKASDLRAILNNGLTEHVDLAAAATRAGFDGQPQFEASAKALDNNSVALSKAIGSVYGADAEKRFLEIWRSHIGFFVDYTVAAKTGDMAGMDKAVQNLMGYVEAFSSFLSQANPNLPNDVLQAKVTDHVLQLKGAVDAYGAGDYAKSYALQAEASEHMAMTADTLSSAIVKQFPDKF